MQRRGNASKVLLNLFSACRSGLNNIVFESLRLRADLVAFANGGSDNDRAYRDCEDAGSQVKSYIASGRVFSCKCDRGKMLNDVGALPKNDQLVVIEDRSLTVNLPNQSKKLNHFCNG